MIGMAYSFRDVLAHTGATRSQLIHWTNVGLVRAEVDETTGTGHHRAFSFANLAQVRVAVLLTGRGVTVPGLKLVLRVVTQLQKRDNVPDIIWIPDSAKTLHAVWSGTTQEFVQELRHPVAGPAEAGMIVKLREVVDMLAVRTASG